MIKVYSEYELILQLQQSDTINPACISLGDPGTTTDPFIKSKIKNILRFEFYDINEYDAHRGNSDIAKKWMIPKMIDFYEQNKNADPFFIHCNAGIGRSPAVALALLYLETGSEQKAKTELQKIRPGALPNRLVISLFDQVLGSHLSKVNSEIWKELIMFTNKEKNFNPKVPDDISS